MNRILELTQKRAALFDEADAILKLAETEKRAMTAEEQASFDGKKVEMEALARTIKAATDLEAVRPDAASGGSQPASVRQPATVHNNAEDKPWGGFGEFLLAVRHADVSNGRSVDPRLLASRASGMNEAIPSEGGFLVETDYASTIEKRMYELGQVVNRCRSVPISGNSNGLKLKAVDESSRVNGSRWGGVQAYWADEAASVTGTKPSFRDMELRLNKLFATYYITDELMQDSAALAGLAQQAFAEELNFKVEDAIIRGTGSGQPDGILVSGALVSVAKETSQAAATILFENIVKMWSRLWARSRQNAVWFINQDIEPQLYGMTIKVKNVAGTENVGGAPAYMPPGGVSGNQYGTLFGRPVVPVEYCSTLGTQGDIILADLSQYLLINKGGLQSAQSMHVKFLTDEMCFRMTYRVDGQPTWNLPLTPFKGSATQSPFIVLDTRA